METVGRLLAAQIDLCSVLVFLEGLEDDEEEALDQLRLLEEEMQDICADAPAAVIRRGTTRLEQTWT